MKALRYHNNHDNTDNNNGDNNYNNASNNNNNDNDAITVTTVLADKNETNNYYYYHINNLLESSSVDFLPYLLFEATRVTQRATWGNQVIRGGSVGISRSASSALGGWRLGGFEACLCILRRAVTKLLENGARATQNRHKIDENGAKIEENELNHSK